MGAERKTIRVFADVIPGFDPNVQNWNGPGQVQYHMTPPPNSKRLWFDIEVPADHEIWPEQFQAGVNIGNLLNPPPRRILIEDQAPRPEADEPRVRPARRMPRAEIRADDDMGI